MFRMTCAWNCSASRLTRQRIAFPDTIRASLREQAGWDNRTTRALACGGFVSGLARPVIPFCGRCSPLLLPPRDLFHFGRQTMRVCKQDADLPHLLVAQCSFEARHAAQAYAVRDLPVRFTRRVVRHALAAEEMRRLRKHAL